MVLHLAQLGEDLTVYDWDHMKLWSNTVIHDIASGRYTWLDKRDIESEKYKTAIYAGTKSTGHQKHNVCPLFNKGQCTHTKSHGEAFLHACAYCWLTWNVENTHPIGLCKKRLGSQNGNNNHYRQNRSHSPSCNLRRLE